MTIKENKEFIKKTYTNLSSKFSKQRIQAKIKHNKRLLIRLSFFSSVVEYYDFFSFSLIFFYFISVFNHQGVGIYIIALISLVSFIVRPLGYRLQIWCAKCYPRRLIILINGSILIISILMPGLLVNAEHELWLNILLIVVSRILNGISFGIKLQVSANFIRHTIPRKLASSVVNSTLGAQLGLTLSIFVIKLIYTHLTGADLEWGWRIPFFFGGLMAVVLVALHYYAYPVLLGVVGKFSGESIALDKIAKKAGGKMWLGLVALSIRGGITFTLFIVIPFLLGWISHTPLLKIVNIMSIATTINTVACIFVRKYLKALLSQELFGFVILLLLLSSGFLGWAIFVGNQFWITTNIYLLSVLSAYASSILPEIIEKSYPREYGAETMLFISNFEYLFFNLTWRIGMLGCYYLWGKVLSGSMFLVILAFSFWITIFVGILAVVKIKSASIY